MSPSPSSPVTVIAWRTFWASQAWHTICCGLWALRFLRRLALPLACGCSGSHLACVLTLDAVSLTPAKEAEDMRERSRLRGTGLACR